MTAVPMDLTPDNAAAPCAACGTPATAVEGQRLQRQGVGLGDGRFVLLMLCLDVSDCQTRTRMGLTPAGYAKLLKSGAKP